MNITIYQEIILENYKFPKNVGRIVSPTNTTIVHNPLCGDKIILDILIKDNRVQNIKFVGQGCVISQALSSLLTEYAKNKTKNELRKLDRTFMIKILGIELGPNRLKCALLPLEALHKVLS